MHIPSPRSSRSHLEAFSSWRSALCPSPTSLRAYFTSGWAFFIPYLLIYLLYYWRKWPANSSAPSALGHGGYIPALLHVYWALHVINAILAVIALRSWWCEAKREAQRAESDLPPATADRSLATVHRSPSTGTAFSAALRAVAPWLFLTLIFAIPGVYLEWPSDPWEHLRRITEWNTHPLVGSHSAGYKSFYFFAYSWVGWLVPTHLLSWLNVYYTSVCMLLAWQYYRLAKTVGLDRRWAFLFVIVNALTFGNSCFSFYRYYGLSTSIYAQLGAVALTRIVLEAAQNPQLSLRSFFRSPFPRSSRFVTANRQPSTVHRLPFPADQPPTVYRLLPALVYLLAFIGFNHVQGIGIAGLSVAAICGWRLIEWKRSALWWLFSTILLTNALFIWLYSRSAAIETYRLHGWLNSLYGFNIFNLTSHAGNRMVQILGVFGFVNLGVSTLLDRRYRTVTWMTLLPLVALSLPCIAVPFSDTLFNTGGDAGIITFHRMIFALPSCLALAAFGSRLVNDARYKTGISRSKSRITFNKCRSAISSSPSAFVILVLTAATTIPSSTPSYNRLWHFTEKTSADLCMRPILAIAELPLFHQSPSPWIISTCSVGEVLHTMKIPRLALAWRALNTPATKLASLSIQAIKTPLSDERLLVTATHFSIFSPYSFASLLSNHWPAQQLAFDQAGSAELINEAIRSNALNITSPQAILYRFPPSN